MANNWMKRAFMDHGHVLRGIEGRMINPISRSSQSCFYLCDRSVWNRGGDVIVSDFRSMLRCEGRAGETVTCTSPWFHLSIWKIKHLRMNVQLWVHKQRLLDCTKGLQLLFCHLVFISKNPVAGNSCRAMQNVWNWAIFNCLVFSCAPHFTAAHWSANVTCSLSQNWADQLLCIKMVSLEFSMEGRGDYFRRSTTMYTYSQLLLSNKGAYQSCTFTKRAN